MGNSSGAGAWWWGRGKPSVSGPSESRIYGTVVSVNRQQYTVDIREYIVVWMWPTRGGVSVSKGVGPGVDVTLVAKMARRESVCREFARELECRADCSIFRISDETRVVGYAAPTVAQIAGITYRQLDYWTRTGLVTASITPRRRPRPDCRPHHHHHHAAHTQHRRPKSRQGRGGQHTRRRIGALTIRKASRSPRISRWRFFLEGERSRTAERPGYLKQFSELLGWKLRTLRPVAGPLLPGWAGYRRRGKVLDDRR